MNKTGCLLRPSNTRNYKFPVCDVSDKDLPSTFILSDERIPTVRNQGNIGACVGHGIAEVLGILYGLEFGKEKLISPWYIYGNPECRDGFTGYGMFLCDAIEGVRKCGSVPLEDFDVRLEVPDIITAVKNRSELTDKAKPYRIKSYIEIPCYALVSKRKSALKQALYTYKLPIVIASANYFGGGHCVIVIGWDKKIDSYSKIPGEQAIKITVVIIFLQKKLMRLMFCSMKWNCQDMCSQKIPKI